MWVVFFALNLYLFLLGVVFGLSPTAIEFMASIETHYEIHKDGSVKRVRSENIVLSAQVLTKLAGQINSGAPYAIPFKDDECMSFCLRNNETILATRLKQLTLTTNYLYKDNFLYPCFGEASGFVKLTAIWQVPENMQLFFALVCVGPPKEFTNQYINQCYLFARHTNQKKYPGYFKLQLSNMYEDGKICMGERIKGVKCTDYGKTMQRALDILHGADWNSDLTPRDFDLGKNLFRFTPDEMATIHVDDNWTKYCVKCSHPYIDAINAYL